MFSTPDDAEQAFYSAFNSGGVEAMDSVWIDDDSIVCVHPGSHPLAGRREIMESWKHILAGPGRLEHEVHSRSQGPMLAIHVGHEWAPDSPAPTPVLVVTNVFQLTSEGWLMLLHHASPVAEQSRPDTPLH